jgi:hypothetical protein
VKPVISLRPETYTRHSLHSPDRVWTETNCSLDVWIEVIHSLGLDPTPAAVCALSADFIGDQWRFLKFPVEDLRRLYGLNVEEINVWRPLGQHIEEHLAAGRLVTVEADAFFLPDTAGTAYRRTHTKSTIVANAVDIAGRRLAYFHGTGYWELSGADCDAVLQSGVADSRWMLPPYAEVVTLDRLVRRDADLTTCAKQLAREHIGRRPPDNPVVRLARRVEADAQWLARQGIAAFHQYAFGSLRQCGANAELAASALTWLADRGAGRLSPAAAAFASAAAAAKSAQFKLARAGRRGTRDVHGVLDAVAEAWGQGTAHLAVWSRHPADERADVTG